MMQAQQIEELICVVSSMDRAALTEKFLNFRGQFPVDFTSEFLRSIPLDRMRHIFIALCLQSHHLPEVAMTPAA